MTEPIRIEDAGDPRIAEFVSMRERDITGRGNAFIAEGKVVLNALLAPGSSDRFSLEKLFLLENRLEGMADVIARLPPDTPVYYASGQVMDAVAGFAMHRGILGLGRHHPPKDADSLIASLPENALVVAAIGISNHDNMGSIFRNAGVFGADAVLIDETSCDPLYRKAIRVSVGAALRVRFARAGSAESLIGALSAHDFQTIGLSPRGPQDIAVLKPRTRTALIAGAEGPGLPVDVLERVTAVRIPQAPGMDSLNVATATGIALWQISRAMGRLN